MADTALDPNRRTLRPKLFWFNLGLTVAVMVTLVANVMPLPFVFMVGSAIALLVNFPKVKDQGAQLIAHAPSIVAVVSMVMAAAVLTGVLNGTGMVKAMSAWLVQIIPADMGPLMAVITGVLSIPMTFFMSNDAFYFGVLPVLSETAAHYGVGAADMARASITGQPFHLQSPLVPAILLLVSLAKVDLGRPPQEGPLAHGRDLPGHARRRSPHRSHRHRLTPSDGTATAPPQQRGVTYRPFRPPGWAVSDPALLWDRQ